MIVITKAVDRKMINAALDAIGFDSKRLDGSELSFSELTITLELNELPRVSIEGIIVNKEES